MALKVSLMELRVLNESVIAIIESEIIAEKSQSLACPSTSIRRGGDHIVASAFLQTSLSIFCHSLAGKDA
jgi:hypothetical protein